MTIDVYLQSINDEFLDDIEEIMEESMVQMFMVHAKTEEELKEIQEAAEEYQQIFYIASLALRDHIDSNCVAYYVDSIESLQKCADSDKPLYIEASTLNDNTIHFLQEHSNLKGIILNATENFEILENFFIDISFKNIEHYDKSILEKLPMNRIVLSTHYPDFDFDTIFLTSKKISDVLFRPDPSIIAQATQNALTLFGFKK